MMLYSSFSILLFIYNKCLVHADNSLYTSKESSNLKGIMDCYSCFTFWLIGHLKAMNLSNHAQQKDSLDQKVGLTPDFSQLR